MKMNVKKSFLFRFFAVSLLVILFTVEVRADNVTELQQRLDEILSQANCQVSAEVVSAGKYDLLYSYNPQNKQIPASVTKIVTAALALTQLGLDYKFKTVVYTDDSNFKDGVINGNIYLKGYGDPDLNSSDIIYLAKQIHEKGIKEITGNIIYDESFFDNQHYTLGYNNDTDQRYWPYVSALNLDKNYGGYDPAYTAGELLATDLTSLGVSFNGTVTAGTTPTQSVKQLTEVSHSIEDVLAYMNKTSNNHSAITLFKGVGAKKYGPPGTFDKGSRAAIELLTSIGCNREEFEILEGSGLTRYNYMTADMMIRLLKYLYDDEDLFNIFYNTLAIAGVDGTIQHRMVGTEAEKNVHAKTGTINSVSALAGYAVTRDMELLIFYISMNGYSGSSSYYRGLQDDFCEALCQFSR